MLRELLVHLHSKRRWQTAAPVYRKLKIDPQTGVLENTVELRPMKFLPGTRLWGHNRWYQYGIGNPNSRTFNPVHLCGVRIPFNKDNYVQNARIEYRVEEGGGIGFYYLTVHEWVARCSDPSECVALLDRLDLHISLRQVSIADLTSSAAGEPSAAARARVQVCAHDPSSS
jgi:hypothetical protein